MWKHALSLLILSATLRAGPILLTGIVTQSTVDGTGPAMNNPSLNQMTDGQAFTLELDFSGLISGAGSYALSAGTFSVPAVAAQETGFNTLQLLVTESAGVDVFSLLGCLDSGSGCYVGNELTANFSIPSAQIDAMNVPATGLDEPHPLDLLEDDGTTDIHADISSYSSVTEPPTVPEPSTGLLALTGLAACLVRGRKSSRKEINK